MDQTSYLRTISVGTTADGLFERFTFEVPKGSLAQNHVEVYLEFLATNNMAKVIKSLTSIYFTADAGAGHKMSDNERLFMERALNLLAEHADCKLFTTLNPIPTGI